VPLPVAARVSLAARDDFAVSSESRYYRRRREATVSVQFELIRRGIYLYVYARRIGITEYRLRRILRGRVKSVSDEEVRKIAEPLGIDPADLRNQIDAASQDRRDKVAQAD
jgi:hypothetical protein